MYFCEFIFDLESVLIRHENKMEINKPIADFICKNRNKCYIITKLSLESVSKIICTINMEDRTYYYFKERGYVSNCKKNITDIYDRILEMENKRIMVIVSGSIEKMLLFSNINIKIAFCVSQYIAGNVFEYADYVIYNADKLVDFLYRLG